MSGKRHSHSHGTRHRSAQLRSSYVREREAHSDPNDAFFAGAGASMLLKRRSKRLHIDPHWEHLYYDGGGVVGCDFCGETYCYCGDHWDPTPLREWKIRSLLEDEIPERSLSIPPVKVRDDAEVNALPEEREPWVDQPDSKELALRVIDRGEALRLGMEGDLGFDGNEDWFPAMRALNKSFCEAGLLNVVYHVLELEEFWVRAVEEVADMVGELLLLPVGDRVERLVGHLFVIYPPPAFLWKCWEKGRQDYLDLEAFIYLSQGGHLGEATKVMNWMPMHPLVPFMFSAPRDCSLDEALEWAHIHRLGGTVREYERMRLHDGYMLPTRGFWRREDGSEAERNKKFLDFWLATVQWLIRYGDEVTNEQCPDILTWALHLHTEDCARGKKFTWKARTPASVLRHAAAYRAELLACGGPDGKVLRWPALGWDWRAEDEQGRVWEVTELTSSVQLYREGVAMHHCVGSYVEECFGMRSSVCSLTCDGERRLTVQIELMEEKIAQARGLANRAPKPDEWAMLKRWYAEVVEVVFKLQ